MCAYRSIPLLAFVAQSHYFTLPAPSQFIHATRISQATSLIDERIAIDESLEGVQKINTNPDIFIIQDFLDKKSCTVLINKATEKKMNQSPVAYAGKTDDIKELLGLAAKGPVVWLGVLSAYFQIQSSGSSDVASLLVHAVQNYIAFFLLAAVSIFAFVQSREDGLQELRTSTSTTLDDLSVDGTLKFVQKSADLFNPSGDNTAKAQHAQYFESPTIIRYEAGQSLAPHFDANRSAETEDANRGGQTLATLLLYLNDVEDGGKTRFGLIPSPDDKSNDSIVKDESGKLTVKPKAGDALLFFPADKNGEFDDRLEHEGTLAVDEKWIARIWRHIDRVPPPFGLSNSELLKLEK